MDGKVTYHQQVSYCGKPRCRKCREGVGHGPYWYAYRTVNGHTTRTYIGKHLPLEAYEALNAEVDGEAVLDTVVSEEDASNPPRSQQREALLQNAPLVRIYILGQFRLERRSGVTWQPMNDASWQQQRPRALLAYLISNPERKASRGQILVDLWPNGENGQDSLNSAIHSLRRILETSHRAKEHHLLSSENDTLFLADQTAIWIDADAFEKEIQLAASERSTEQREKCLEQALALYSGDFLSEERRASWVLKRRQVLRQRWGESIITLVDLRIARDAADSTIDLLDRLLAVEPVNEAAIQRLIAALARLKRRGEALRAYYQFAKVLQRDYHREPSEETRLLYDAVAKGETNPMRVFATPTAPVQAAQGGGIERSTKGVGKEAVRAEQGASLSGRVGKAADVELAQIGRTHQSPLVGRERELDTLRSMLTLTEQRVLAQHGSQRRGYAAPLPLDTQRQPQFVLLLGEAGIGKTRLAEEMSRDARARGWSVIWSRAYAQEDGIPYRIWIEILRKALGPLPAQPSQSLLMRDALAPLGMLIPELQAANPTLFASTFPSLRDQEQLRLWEAVHALLTSLSESSPLLIVLDDVQWADASSCELLGYLARHLQGHPLLLVATCRKNELTGYSKHPLRRLVEHMQREHSVLPISVEPLTREQIVALVSHIPHLSEPMVQHIQSNADGNPFFAEELARSTPPTLPENIAAALDHRMKRLSEPCQQLLWNAAVLGGSFEFPLISSMEADRGGAREGIDEDSVLELLEEALGAGVITEEGAGTHITYHFWHPLLVSHLYDTISAARRARLHRRAATVMQQMYRGREEKVAATITHHLMHSDADPALIAQYAALAGDYAYSLSAYAEAERHYRTVMEQVNILRTQMGVNSDEAAMPREVSGAVLERLAECTMILGNFAEAAQLYDRLLAVRAMRGAQYAAEPGLNSQYEAQIQALIWGEIGQARRNTGDNEQAQQCFMRGEQVLRAANVLSGPAWARLRYLQGMLYWQEGRYQEAQEAAQEALALFSAAERQHKHINAPVTSLPTRQTTRTERTLEGDPINLGRTHRLLGSIANAVGRRDEALAHLNTALAIYEQYDHKREIAHVCNNLGHIYLKHGDYELAQAALRRSLSLAERTGDTPLTSIIFSNLAELAAASDDLLEAEEWYRRSLALAERFHDLRYVSTWSVGLAAILQKQGKLDEAAACITRSWHIARAMQNTPSIGDALIALASLRLAQAQVAEPLPRMHARLLALARKDVERALALKGLEAETRAQGKIVLARITQVSQQTTSSPNA